MGNSDHLVLLASNSLLDLIIGRTSTNRSAQVSDLGTIDFQAKRKLQ